MYRGEYLRLFNNVTAAVSDGSKDEARGVLKHLVNRILADKDDYYFRRLVDDLMMHWYDTYKKGGRGAFLPREVAGLKGRAPE